MLRERLEETTLVEVEAVTHGLRARAAIHAEPLRQAPIAIPVLAFLYRTPPFASFARKALPIWEAPNSNNAKSGT
jgi:hypothetical protein